MNETNLDAFDSASNVQLQAFDIYGEISIDAWHCVLKKGEGKRPYQDGQDDLADRKTAIDIILHPIEEMNSKFQHERSLIAESMAWAKITWPSLQKLGLNNAREAKNRYCRVKFTATGRKWTNKNGEPTEETTFEFLELFAAKQDCVTAYLNLKGKDKAAALNTDSPEKSNAYKFAVAIVKNVANETRDFGQLTQKVKDKIAAMPVVSKHFTIDSPEIMALIAEAL